MKKILIIIFYLGLSNIANAQFSISGKVVNENKESLPGANIYIPSLELGAVSDQEGSFILKDLPSGKLSLEVSFIGYQKQRVSLDLRGDTMIDIILIETPLLTEEVTVRAIRADKLAPITQRTVDYQELNEVFNGQDGAFVLETLAPSIQANSESGTRFTNYGTMRMRGIDQRRINITLNGVPLNDMMDQGVFFSNFTDFTNSIESIQVQRGVGTSTNGTASYAGSISYESARLNVDAPETTVSLLGGSFNTWQGSAEVKTGLLENKMAFYSRVSLTSSDGFRDHSGTDSYSFFFSGGYFGDKDIIRFTGFNGRTQNQLSYIPVPISLARENPRTNVNFEDDRDNFGQSFAQLEHTRMFSKNTTLTSSLYYGGAGGDFPFGFEDGEAFMQINYPLFNNHYGAMSYLQHSTDTWDLSTGVHAYTFRRKNIEQLVPNFASPYYEDRSVKDEFSAFAKASYTLSNWMFFGDIQGRFVNLQMFPDTEFLGENRTVPLYSWQFLNPKVGVTYQFSPLQNVYGSFGRTGREPNRSDFLGGVQINAGNIDFLQDQNNVRAEFVNNYEVGYRIASEHTNAQINFFYMDFENEIAPIGAFVPQFFLQLYANQEDSYRRGVELDWTSKFTDKLRFVGNATYMRSVISRYQPEGGTEVFNDIRTPYSPEVFLNARLQYSPLSRLQLEFHSRYVGESYTELTNNPDFILPAYWVNNLRVSTKIGKHYTFDLEVNNLFNELYFTDGAPLGNELAVFAQAPRHFFGRFTARF
ncbi:TonB-dependent receptor [Cecembia sp.]|uniref:TonB-dependent receptor n=1 Tax=Cecembia sp. TaxID=1898110 RepID=UPI0025C66937|nr:TonB-dependent receptor [Cecembia sp.]